jgi:hypothetical protein
MNNEMLKTIDEDKLADVAGGGALADLAAGVVGAGFDLWKDITVSRIQGTADAWEKFRGTVSGLLGR